MAVTAQGIGDLDRQELLALARDFGVRWLAHDGLWFQAVEAERGMAEAIRHDKSAWERFTVIEARRIMRFLGLEPGGGLPALLRALNFRLYALVNEQEVVERSEKHCVFRMRDCRVQSARRRKGMDDFPCKEVGIEEYGRFAATIDPRITTRCLYCPPDEHPEDAWCAWEFTLED